MTHISTRCLCLAFALLTAALTAPAPAQPGGAPKPADPPAFIDWTTRGLSPAPVELPSVGLTVHLPADSAVTIDPNANRRILAQASDKSWVLALDVIRTGDPNVTKESLLDSSVNSAVRAIAGVPADHDISKYIRERVTFKPRETLDISGAEALLAELRLQLSSGAEEIRMITVINPSPETHLIYTMWFDGADKERADRFRALYRSSLDSMTLADPEVLARERLEAVEATESAMSALTDSNYRAVMGPDRWYRIYRPDGSAERELGYYVVSEKIGPLGELTPNRNAADYAAGEKEIGLIIRLLGRYLQPDGSVYDVESISWMSYDRRRETFSIRSAWYQKLTEGGYSGAMESALTGTRNEGTVKITSEFPNEPVRQFSLTRPPKAYISQVDVHLLYRLLKPWTHDTYGMFAFEPIKEGIAYRVEKVLRRNADGSVVMRSHRTPDAVPNDITLDADGLILRIEKGNGEITVPADPREIQRLWKAKGLPTESMKSRAGASGRR